jgi:hypothetical protein
LLQVQDPTDDLSDDDNAEPNAAVMRLAQERGIVEAGDKAPAVPSRRNIIKIPPTAIAGPSSNAEETVQSEAGPAGKCSFMTKFIYNGAYLYKQPLKMPLLLILARVHVRVHVHVSTLTIVSGPHPMQMPLARLLLPTWEVTPMPALTPMVV